MAGSATREPRAHLAGTGGRASTVVALGGRDGLGPDRGGSREGNHRKASAGGTCLWVPQRARDRRGDVFLARGLPDEPAAEGSGGRSVDRGIARRGSGGNRSNRAARPLARRRSRRSRP